jgi:hypothetical protein
MAPSSGNASRTKRDLTLHHRSYRRRSNKGKNRCNNLLEIWQSNVFLSMALSWPTQPCRELHAQKLTVREIKDRLAAGKTSTGQVVNLTKTRLYGILQNLGLKPHRYSPGYLSARQKAVELDRASICGVDA